MSQPPHYTRELGIEFGDLESKLREHGYPATNEELVDTYGEHVLELSMGTESVAELLESQSNQTYESHEEARQAIFNLVGSRAIGRKNYSDRTPPAIGEKRENEQLSF